MPSLNFQQRFAGKVESGEKPHTIRAKRKRPIKSGDTLYLFTGMRTKYCRRLATKICTKVEAITIDWRTKQVCIYKPVFDCMVPMNNEEIRKLAIKDGFDSVAEFYKWFVSESNPEFEGDLIWWE